MTEEIRRIPYKEFSEHLAEIIRLVVEEDQSIEVEIETGKRAVLIPAPTKKQHHQDTTMADQEMILSAVGGQDDETLFQDLQTLRQKILMRRGGKMINPEILNQIREEREHELTSLH